MRTILIKEEKIAKETTEQPKVRLGPRAKVTAAVRAFEAVQANLREFIDENPEVFQELFELVEEYNQVLAGAKAEMKELSTEETINIGPFTRSKNSQEQEVYNPDKLPVAVLQVPGVVTAVDTKVIRNLLASGHVDFSSVKAARSTSPGKSPSVRGPKPVVIDV
jgi:hypothetical protein